MRLNGQAKRAIARKRADKRKRDATALSILRMDGQATYRVCRAIERYRTPLYESDLKQSNTIKEQDSDPSE